MTWPFLEHPRPFGFAHRGGTTIAPENTEAAFAHAVSLGYRYLETDVRATADGVLVAFHDSTLDRVAGVSGAVEEMTWAELCSVTFDGHSIPRFDALIRQFPDVRWNIEPKGPTSVEFLIELIETEDLIDRICVGSFHEERIKQMADHFGPRLCRSAVPKEVFKSLVAAFFYPKWKPPFGVLQVPTNYGPIPLATKFLVRRFHKLGLQVHIWTINDRDDMEKLLDIDIDAIMSDEVETLRDVLQTRGRWPGSEIGYEK